ncbi:isocitrate/isopropylmalate family dehydrogenase [Dechloromonas sp. A34]|uniref:isocitrate/isopropylmalate family dehydrogenase n=1 Tax=Dechloromonas sp. A34 TaxID=447588 RepID=UPI002B0519EC|nr:isocitrate/isopropylmalate family dehydrogenase [Dechloromonas sp. A34]
MKRHSIAVIAGDGIGNEVMPEGLRVLEAAARKFGIGLDLTTYDWANCDYYLQHGQMMPDDWFAQLRGMRRSSSAPPAGRPRCPTIFRCGARCSSSAASSTST